MSIPKKYREKQKEVIPLSFEKIEYTDQVIAMQQDYYKKRIGKVYGDYIVESVEYDRESRKQRWKLRCTKCGKERVTYDGKDFVKGRLGVCQECKKFEKELNRIFDALKKQEEDEERAREIVGKTFGNYYVIDYDENKGYYAICTHCLIGKWRSKRDLERRTQDKCTCKMGIEEWHIPYDSSEWIGRKYGHLTITGYSRGNGGVGRGFICKCDCGNEKIVRPTHLFSKQYVSCGFDCPYHMENYYTKKRMSGSRLYIIWRGMKSRCYNEKSAAYKRYGGRGITICGEWRDDFFAFAKWAKSNGYSDDLTIDRIDCDGNYEPSNCRWATTKQQAENRHPAYTFTERKPIKKKSETINGETKPIVEWAEIYGITMQAVYYRMKNYGMTFEEAVTTPKHQGYSK